MAEPFIGEIRMVGFNFAPPGWAFCNGQLIPLSENTALFSLLGTTYGGDGRTTFALPDFRSRGPIHSGAGPGLSQRELGEMGGEEAWALPEPELKFRNLLLIQPSWLTPPQVSGSTAWSRSW